MYSIIYPGELRHHGIKGQKWGVRRYQNEDGSRTPEGKLRYSYDVVSAKENVKRARKDIRKVKKADYPSQEEKKTAVSAARRRKAEAKGHLYIEQAKKSLDNTKFRMLDGFDRQTRYSMFKELGLSDVNAMIAVAALEEAEASAYQLGSTSA